MKKPAYRGKTNADVRFHDGALRPVIGVCNMQVMRANREHPELSQGTGHTYNHAPMLCRWRGMMYLMYLSSPVHEHCGHGRAMIMHSPDGFSWSMPEILFPEIPVPPGIYCGKDPESLPDNAYSVVHHRMGFYIAPSGVLLAMTFHGVSPHIHAAPNSGYGMGRVVRRIYPDGTFGDIHVLRVNTQAGWKKEHFPYPWYADSSDGEFIAACEALLNDTMANGAWWEEERLDTEFFPLAGIKAPSFCKMPDGTLTAIGKAGLTSVSHDEGRTWTEPEKAEGISTSGGKCCLTRTGDGRYAIIYNPNPDGQHRWPLAAITGDNGYDYDDMLCICGEVPPMRYGGWLKNVGPQYVRTIMPGNDDAPDGYTWITYSMNKEDIWVARLPKTLTCIEKAPVHDVFSEMTGTVPEKWHIYSPLWAQSRIENGCLTLRDSEPYDYAKAMRTFPEGAKVCIRIKLTAENSSAGELYIDVSDSKGMTAARAVISDRMLYVRCSDGKWPVAEIKDGAETDICIDVDCARQTMRLGINGEWDKVRPLMGPAPSVERLILRTGPVRIQPTPETELKNVCPPDADRPGERLSEAVFSIRSVETV